MKRQNFTWKLLLSTKRCTSCFETMFCMSVISMFLKLHSNGGHIQASASWTPAGSQPARIKGEIEWLKCI